MSLQIESRAKSAEFERQVENLVGKGYQELAELSADEFRRLLEPLGRRLDSFAGDGEIPFVLVPGREWLAVADLVGRVEREGKPGFSALERDDLARFEPIARVEQPAGKAYLLLDVDTGESTKNVTPIDAFDVFAKQGRSPLTVEEGVALVTHFPEAIAKNNGFSMLGSRAGDKRVTAWWISKGQPKLGWCWAGNPHTWLGSASCGSRLGPSD